MIRYLRTGWRCVRRAAYSTVMVHDGIEHAGYLAFLGLLALFPFLVFLVAVVGVLGQGESGAHFIGLFLERLPQHITNALRPRIEEIVSGPPQGLLTASILGAIWTASSAVEGLRTVLNRAYHVATPPTYLFRRSMSVLQLLVFTSILIVSMLMAVAIPLFLHHVEGWLGRPFLSSDEHSFGQGVVWLTFVSLFVAIAYIYYTIPNIKQRFISVAPGAALVAGLWIGAASLFSAYLSNFEQVNLIYGSLGGIIAALVFFYICNIIFIFGAELNHQIVVALGLRLKQREQAAETVPQESPADTEAP
jgi:membrane protein